MGETAPPVTLITPASPDGPAPQNLDRVSRRGTTEEGSESHRPQFTSLPNSPRLISPAFEQRGEDKDQMTERSSRSGLIDKGEFGAGRWEDVGRRNVTMPARATASKSTQRTSKFLRRVKSASNLFSSASNSQPPPPTPPISPFHLSQFSPGGIESGYSPTLDEPRKQSQIKTRDTFLIANPSVESTRAASREGGNSPDEGHMGLAIELDRREESQSKPNTKFNFLRKASSIVSIRDSFLDDTAIPLPQPRLVPFPNIAGNSFKLQGLPFLQLGPKFDLDTALALAYTGDDARVIPPIDAIPSPLDAMIGNPLARETTSRTAVGIATPARSPLISPNISPTRARRPTLRTPNSFLNAVASFLSTTPPTATSSSTSIAMSRSQSATSNRALDSTSEFGALFGGTSTGGRRRGITISGMTSYGRRSTPSGSTSLSLSSTPIEVIAAPVFPSRTRSSTDPIRNYSRSSSSNFSSASSIPVYAYNQRNPESLPIACPIPRSDRPTLKFAPKEEENETVEDFVERVMNLADRRNIASILTVSWVASFPCALEGSENVDAFVEQVGCLLCFIHRPLPCNYHRFLRPTFRYCLAPVSAGRHSSTRDATDRSITGSVC
jgi:hypothetical protein